MNRLYSKLDVMFQYEIIREYAGAKKRRFKPVIISHHMLMGLKEGQEKMSKSNLHSQYYLFFDDTYTLGNPDSAIFMEDTVEDVNRKIKKAYCPELIIDKNPIIDYTRNIVMAYFGGIVLSIDGVGFHYFSC